MLILSTIILLISNALTHIRELAILFSRSIMYLLFIICILTIDNFNLIFLSKGISIYSGLFFVKPYLETFSFFIYLITALILLLTSYYPRSFLNPVKSQEYVEIAKTVKNENLEQYKIIEYSLLILFVLNGAILLMASNDLVSIFLCLELQSYSLYLFYAVYKNSEFSTKASLTYFLFGGLALLIFYRELKKISNIKWFLSKICDWFLSWLWKRFLSYIWKNPILVKNISLFVVTNISLFLFNNQYIFLEHFFYTMDSFDSYTIMYDMFDINFSWEIDYYPTPLLGHRVNAKAKTNTSNTGNNGNTSNTSNTGNSGDSGSGPKGGGEPSGPSGLSGGNGNDSKRKKRSGPSEDNGNDSKRKKRSGPSESNGNESKRKKPSAFFSKLYPDKHVSQIIYKDEPTRVGIRKESIAWVKSQVSKHGIEVDSNNRFCWGPSQELNANRDGYLRTDNDLLSKIGMTLHLYNQDLTTRPYIDHKKRVVTVFGRYEDIFPEDMFGKTHPFINLLHEYHMQVSKNYRVSDFNERINRDFLIRLNKNLKYR